jgi:signal peptidase I
MARGKKRRRSPPPLEEEAVQPVSASENGEEERTAPAHRKSSGISIPKPKGPLGEVYALAVIVGLALALALATQAWVAKPFQIPSGSMEPTLAIGQRIIVNRLSYHFGDPDLGDIIVFHPPAGAETDECGAQINVSEPCPMPTAGQSGQYYVKRLVAGPGDTLSIKNGHPVVNGVEKTDEPYARPCGVNIRCNLPTTITIPPGHYFMMGDNRGESDDSRVWGPVPRDWIVGKAFASYWPLDRWELF